MMKRLYRPLLSRPITTNVKESRRLPRSYNKVHTLSISTPDATAAAELDSFASFNNNSLNFDDNTESIFKDRTTLELLRAWTVFRVCGVESVVTRSQQLLKLSENILGRDVTTAALKATFFGHFCGGTDGDSIKPTINSLRASGVGSILDYAAEADVGSSAATGEDNNTAKAELHINDDMRMRVSARTYDYENEALCDANAQIAMHAITAAAEMKDGFSAIKMTALGKPEFLQRISTILTQTRDIFKGFDQPNIARPKHSVPSASLARFVDEQTFVEGLIRGGSSLSRPEASALFRALDIDQDGGIDVIEWVEGMDPLTLSLGPLGAFRDVPELTEMEVEQLRSMLARVEALASVAAERGVRLMVDAEQSYMQPAIDHVVLHLQRKYNREKPVVYNTLQCYLTASASELEMQAERARREGWQYGVKLVRGAYMIQERALALEQGERSPIHPSLGATHASFDAAVEFCLRMVARGAGEVLVASHNEHSIQKTAQRMADLGLAAEGGGVFFGQLLGMCDHVTLAMGARGYQVYKYVPYGPVHEVMPYLLRRAEENATMLQGNKRDMLLLTGEIKRRFGLGGGGGVFWSAVI